MFAGGRCLAFFFGGIVKAYGLWTAFRRRASSPKAEHRKWGISIRCARESDEKYKIIVRRVSGNAGT